MKALTLHRNFFNDCGKPLLRKWGFCHFHSLRGEHESVHTTIHNEFRIMM